MTLDRTLATLLDGHRDYQATAHARAIAWCRASVDPGLIEAATGAGKSHIVASVACELHALTRRPVLCLQPSGELTTQNARKLLGAFISAGVHTPPVSVYSASTGQKSLRHPIVYGTPGTARGGMSVLRECGAIIIDEAHRITNQVREIVDIARESNPRLRVIGMTATPYRTDTGYIYAQDVDGVATDASLTRDPYFARMIYSVGARTLLDHPAGPYLTPPIVAPIGADAYDIEGLVVRKRGFGTAIDHASEAKVFAGQGRLTALICADIVERTQHLKAGLIFAATVEHAHEILASLPPGSALIVHGKMPKAERARALAALHTGKVRWLINRDILTTGYDEPRIDHVVIMRHMESAGLLQQIIGRTLRLYPGKTAAYVFDYAKNMEKFFAGGRDIFDPKIKPMPEKKEGNNILITCPGCQGEQWAKLNDAFEEAEHDGAGYLIEGGRRIDPEIPVHYTRRCIALVRDSEGRHTRCRFMFAGKMCVECDHVNDIAARKCDACGCEIVDPNDKLVTTSDAHIDATAPRVTRVGNTYATPTTSRKGEHFTVHTVHGVGDFWVPAGDILMSPWKIQTHNRWHSRREGDDALMWYRKRDAQGLLSQFPELIRWGPSQDCPACLGEKRSTVWTVDGKKDVVCVTCAGTGVTFREGKNP